MGKKKIQASVPQNKILLDAIIKGMQDKKGADIMVLDFSKIGGAVCDAFVICTGNSNTQVEAIADAVHEAVKKATGDNPFHTGFPQCRVDCDGLCGYSCTYISA